jgi:hypothetical protein
MKKFDKGDLEMIAIALLLAALTAFFWLPGCCQ